jgi:hypothetical protein
MVDGGPQAYEVSIEPTPATPSTGRSREGPVRRLPTATEIEVSLLGSPA